MTLEPLPKKGCQEGCGQWGPSQAAGRAGPLEAPGPWGSGGEGRRAGSQGVSPACPPMRAPQAWAFTSRAPGRKEPGRPSLRPWALCRAVQLV